LKFIRLKACVTLYSSVYNNIIRKLISFSLSSVYFQLTIWNTNMSVESNSNTIINSNRAPKLSATTSVAYASWITLLHNHLISLQLFKAASKERKDWDKLAALITQWEEDELDNSISIVYGLSKSNTSEKSTDTSSSSFESRSSESNSKTVPFPTELTSSELSESELSARSNIKSYVTKSQRAFGIIYESVPSEIQLQLNHLPTGYAYGALEWLKKKFQSTDPQTVNSLLHEWDNLHMEENETFDVYRARITKLLSLLDAAKAKPNESQIIYKTINKLLPKYHPITMALSVGGKLDPTQIKWEEVASEINKFERENTLQSLSGTNNGFTAYTNQSSSSSSNYKGRTNSYKGKKFIPKGSCYSCGKQGHYKYSPQCPNAEADGANPRTEGQRVALINTEANKNNYEVTDKGMLFYVTAVECSNDEANVFAGISTPSVNSSSPPIPKLKPTQITKLDLPKSKPITLPSPIPQPPGGKPVLNRLIRPNENRNREIRLPVDPKPRKTDPRPIDIALKGTTWGIDTMASISVTGNRSHFGSLRHCTPMIVTGAAGNSITANQVGKVTLRVLLHNKRTITITVDNVYYHEKFTANLISAAYLVNEGYEVHVVRNNCYLITPSGSKVPVEIRGRLLIMEGSQPAHIFAINSSPSTIYTSIDEFMLLHNRLGHPSFDRMMEMMKAQVTDGIPQLPSDVKLIEQAKELILQCPACIKGKLSRSALGHSGIDKGNTTGEVLHMDTFHVTIKAGEPYKYGLVIADAYSGAKWFECVETKDLVSKLVISHLTRVENQLGRRVKKLKSDGGKEFNNLLIKDYCDANGIIFEWSPAYTPQLNGVAERSVRTLKEGGGTLLWQCGLPQSFWNYAVAYFTITWNRTYVSESTSITPYQAYFKKKPNIRHNIVFGCNAYIYLDKTKRESGTFAPRAEPGIYLGHDTNQNCPIAYGLDSKKIIKTKDIRFFQSKFTHADALRQGEDKVKEILKTTDVDMDEYYLIDADEPVQSDDLPVQGGMGASAIPSLDEVKDNDVNTTNDTIPHDSPVDNDDNSDTDEEEWEVEKILRDKPGRSGSEHRYQIKWKGYDQPQWRTESDLKHAKTLLDEYKQSTSSSSSINSPQISPTANVCFVMAEIGQPLANETINTEEYLLKQQLANTISASVNILEQLDETPITYEDATNSPDALKWKLSMDKEIKSCEDSNTWTKVNKSNLPPNINIIPCKWVYKIKNDENGKITEYKSRLTPKGFKQKEGIDYFKVFAQTGMYKTMRLGLCLTAYWDNELDQLDVPSAFLNAELKEDIYMKPPEGYDNEPNIVFKLNKALYGLKQAPREWYLLISKFIIEQLKYRSCLSDPCLFYRKSKLNNLMLLYLFVDDFQSSYHITDLSQWNEVKYKLIQQFNTKDLGPSKWILGMRITRDRKNKTIKLDQELYITKLIEKHGYKNCITKPTPEVELNGSNTKSVDVQRYMEMVGGLIYASIATRPDIAHTVQVLTRHMQTPEYQHQVLLDRVFRYLVGTKDIGLLYGKGKINEITVTGYGDADWVKVKSDYDSNDKLIRDGVQGKSTTGWITKVNGDIINWSSKKQSVVALSSCEAELYAEVDVAKEVLWTRGILEELGLIDVNKSSIIYCDNKSTKTISENGIKTNKTRHVHVNDCWITEKINKGIIDIQWLSSENQQADILTKALGKQLFLRFRQLLMSTEF
jgi:hypothetical protein